MSLSDKRLAKEKPARAAGQKVGRARGMIVLRRCCEPRLAGSMMCANALHEGEGRAARLNFTALLTKS
jgi:hypothetical protein